MKWISVKERLPEESGKYIVHAAWGIVTEMCYSKRHKLFNVLDTYEDTRLSVDVTHWMPLPEPPKEG